MVKLYITNKDWAKIRAGLRQPDVFGNKWSTNAVDTIIILLAKAEFVDAQIATMPEDEEKMTVYTLV